MQSFNFSPIFMYNDSLRMVYLADLPNSAKENFSFKRSFSLGLSLMIIILFRNSDEGFFAKLCMNTHRSSDSRDAAEGPNLILLWM